MTARKMAKLCLTLKEKRNLTNRLLRRLALISSVANQMSNGSIRLKNVSVCQKTNCMLLVSGVD